MAADTLIFTYVITLLTALFAIVVYSERRARSFTPTASRDRVFRCGKCTFVYTDDADVERSRCPQCGKTNDAVKF
ncbi:MAG: hypothetical protein RL380_1225 [Verrucomicrobiota bacterium]|jgi:rubrerythrin